MDVYEFGPFQLDVQRLLLLEHGEPVALGPKVVETLLALIEHPGEVLAKSMLLDRIWPEGFVEEANLAQNIYVLRKLFREHWESGAIETVPRRGYRFVAPVQRMQRHALAEAPIVVVPEPTPAIAPGAVSHVRAKVRRFVAFAAAAVVLVAVLGAAFVPHRQAAQTAHLSANGERLYQIARYYWNLRSRDGVQRSISYFAQVVDNDPNAPQGYVGLADAYAMMGDYCYGSQKPDVYFARAAGFAKKALALDPESGDAHATLGLIALDKGRSAEAIQQLRQAIALDPAYGPAREWYGVALLKEGRVADGYAQLKTAADLDPLSVATTAWLGQASYMSRKYADAIAYSRQALELSPQRSDVLTIIGDAYEVEGNLNRAIEVYRQYARASVDNRAEASALLAHAFALAHRTGDARAQLQYAEAHAKDVSPIDLAAAAAAIGDRTAALGALKNVRDRMTWIAIANDPRFDFLRRDQAFRQLSREFA